MAGRRLVASSVWNELRPLLGEDGGQDAALLSRESTFHNLRHLHASYLARAGVPAKVAQERLGHSSPVFTMRVYTHTLAGQQEAAARAVEEFVLGRSD